MGKSTFAKLPLRFLCGMGRTTLTYPASAGPGHVAVARKVQTVSSNGKVYNILERSQGLWMRTIHKGSGKWVHGRVTFQTISLVFDLNYCCFCIWKTWNCVSCCSLIFAHLFFHSVWPDSTLFQNSTKHRVQSFRQTIRKNWLFECERYK